MSPRPERTTTMVGRFGPVVAMVSLALSACGGSEAAPNESVVQQAAAPTTLASAPATTVIASSTTAAAPVSISVGPPTTSAGAQVQPVAPADAGGAEQGGDAPVPGQGEADPTVPQNTTVTSIATTVATTAPTQPESTTTSPPTTATTATTAAPSTAPTSSPTTAPPSTTTPPTQPPVQIVEFRIAAGTGSRPWNSFSNPVRVRVGQILRVHNDDTTAHAIHAGGSPFQHGKRIDPGSFRDHPVLSPHQPVDGSPQIYDHNNGRGAAFWVVAEG